MSNAIAISGLSPETVDRFWAFVEKSESGCWLWTAGKDKDGYGCFTALSVRYRAHRVSYTLTRGAIPDGLVIDHLCRNHTCVNPAHLEAVTNHENLLRGIASGVGPGRPPAEACKRGHIFSADNIIVVPNGKRCRQCNLEYRRAAYRARAA